MSSPAGQAALHGAVFSRYFGRTNRHDPVLFISVEMFDRDMNNGIFSACFGSDAISPHIGYGPVLFAII
jgi:hypothetical protein